MTKELRFEVSLTTGQFADGICAAAPRPKSKWIAWLFHINDTARTLGWATIGTLIPWIGSGYQIPFNIALIVGAFVSLGGLFLNRFASKRALDEYCLDLVDSRFQRHPAEWILNEDRVTIENTDRTWSTSWAAVDDVTQTKNLIILRMAGLIFMLPASNDDVADPQELFDRLCTWHKAAQ